MRGNRRMPARSDGQPSLSVSHMPRTAGRAEVRRVARVFCCTILDRGGARLIDYTAATSRSSAVISISRANSAMERFSGGNFRCNVDPFSLSEYLDIAFHSAPSARSTDKRKSVPANLTRGICLN